MISRKKYIYALAALIFTGLCQISFAANLNGMWVGYYTQYNKNVYMMMFMHHPGKEAANNVSGMIIDAVPSSLDGLTATLDEASFQDSTLTFLKEYSPQATTLGYFGRVKYRLRLTDENELKGSWQAGHARGEAYFKRVDPVTLAPKPSASVKPSEPVDTTPVPVEDDGDKKAGSGDDGEPEPEQKDDEDL